MKGVSLGITTNMHLSATSWIAKNAQDLGAHRIWIGEDIDLGQEIYSLTSASIVQSENVQVGTAIVPITIHNISTIARAAITLNELNEGKFILGIGIGGIQDLKKKGISLEKPVSALEDAIETLRSLWRGEIVTIKNAYFHLDGFKLRMKKLEEVPIFLGVRGPQMLKLAGEYADGVILSGPRGYLRDAIKSVNQSAQKNNRSPPYKVVWLATIPTSQTEDNKLAKRVVSLIIADTPESVTDKLDIDRDRIEKIRQAVEKNGAEAGVSLITAEILDTFAISGTPDHMIDQYEDLWKMGVNEVVFGPPFVGDWRKATSEVFKELEYRMKSKD
ncbi:MAG: hypothetical protein BAJATHORv1_90078 [Candidatus Thorarchaeota archaeon]|nr:MAG: hypothetical protein BAJATHORv1_90078 [Candidatus Thorarchaeota archaeon]